MLKLFKITCLAKVKKTSYSKGISENDIEVFEQYIFPQNIMALCPLRDDDKLPHAECLIVLAGGNSFQTSEPLNELIERINEAVKDV